MDAYHLLFADVRSLLGKKDAQINSVELLFIYLFLSLSLLQLAIYSTLELCNTLIFS
jgi:hypothetical protein